jgi:hypothetical protein
MKKLLFLIVIYFLFPFTAKAAVEFVSVVDTGAASDSDYSSLSTWETAIGTNLTAPSTLVFTGIVTGTAPIDGSSVTLYRSGAPVGVGATVVHTVKTGTKILLKNVSNPSYGFTTGDEWRINASNFFTIDATTPDQPQVTAKCRATTGTADTAGVDISGWDTDATHYIKVWTDPSENYRHQGKWDVGKYRIEVTDSNVVTVYENYTQFTGIQIQVGSTSSTPRRGIWCYTPDGCRISNNIVKGIGTGRQVGIQAENDSTSNKASYFFNNIVYDMKNTSDSYGIASFTSNSNVVTLYAYNNTVYNAYIGIYRGGNGTNTFISKNNISYNNTDNYSADGFSFDASGTNNLSGPGADAQIPATNKRDGVTVTFADATNNDFHLDSSDTGAKNQGIILYDSGDDSNLNFTTDIDNEARKDSAGTWDIGADENVAKIYRSVGAGATSPLAWGGTADSSYGNMTISGLIATFWRPLPDNIGVGDALQYDADNTGGIDKIVFITKRIDSTHYSVRKADGTAPDATTSLPNSGWGIYRSYISLSNAEAGTENTGITAGVRNFDTGDVNLTTNNLQWNIACYANGTTADTTAVAISGWTTMADNYIRIYTPTRTDEVGTTQRHQGKWDTSKYYMSVTDSNAFNIQADYAWLDGVQITETSPTSAHILLWTSNITAVSNNVRISNNIFKGHNSGTYGEYGLDINDPDIIVRVWNNIIYDIPDLGGSNRGISFSGAVGYIYNNTVIGPNQGIRVTSGDVTAKNNLVQTTSSAYLLTGGTWNSASNYNLADDATAPGTNPQNSKTVSFADSTNKDFHLAPGDSVARNIGTDLTNDLYLPINSDIDSTDAPSGRLYPTCAPTDETCLTRPRATSWDIGADELITKIYRSVGVGTTAAIISGTSPAISLTISGNTGTFATWPTSADFGVGDVIRYDSDNNGSLDSTAFISAIDSTAKTATLQNSTGGAPTVMATPDYDWKLYRAHTSLSAWEAGTANTGIGVTFPGGDRDIATNSEQWNVACYANSGTAPDTTAVTISGWTTAQQNYIKVYTPTLSSEVTTSQRHQGKWDGGKYKIEVSEGSGIVVSDKYVRIDGMQIKITVSSSYRFGIAAGGTGELIATNNIISAVVSGTAVSEGFYISSSGNVKSNNNIIYDFSGSAGGLGMSMEGTGTVYSENDTLHNCYYGLVRAAGTFYIKNAGVAASSGIAFSGPTQITTSSSSTPLFVDASNADHSLRDFHLQASDTIWKNQGTDISADLNLPVTTDIDGQSRPINGTGFSTDIGADEGATAIYRSLAPSATGSIASGTSPANSMIIAGTSVIFGTAPGDTIGVGDAIQYDSDNNGTVDSIAFISGRTSGTVYTIQDRTGGTPTSTSATDYDWSIFRAYTSLQNATGSSTGGTENTGLADAVEHFDIGWSSAHGKDIYKYNQQWNISAYANSTTADSTATTISGWTTYPTNYLKIYTPTATTEVGTNQRAQGKWDDSKYRMEITNGNAIVSYTNFFRAEGIQIKITAANNNWDRGIYSTPGNGTAETQISSCIIRGVFSGTTDGAFGIFAWQSAGSSSSVVKIWNNIIYDFINGSNSNIAGITIAGVWNGYVYNNTVYHNYYGISGSSITSAKNNISYNNTDNYINSFDTSSTNNLTSGTDPQMPTANKRENVTVTFADAANGDFHLASTDAGARNYGADLSTDAYLPITTDIDGHTRPTGTNIVDIGADEGATAIYYSVGQSTSTDFKVASNVSVSGYTATFTTAQTGNIGVGDIVTYAGGSCNITGKTSTSVWTCSNVTGGTAPQVSGVAVTSIKRAFASLEGAVDAAQGTGAHDSSHLNTTNLYTNNYQLNIPCYLDSGTTPDATAVTIQSWTTSVPNYLKVYTPNNITTEANQSQRHQGKWDSTKYQLTPTALTAIDVYTSYVRIDGLQIAASISGYSSAFNATDISIESSAINPAISNSVLTVGILSGGVLGRGIVSITTLSDIWNNIIYGFTNSGIVASGSAYVYNNTVANCNVGIWSNYQSAVVKNNISYNNTDNYSVNSQWGTGSTNNLSGPGTDVDIPATNKRDGVTVTFQDSTNKDFHLGVGGTAAQNYGADLSADTSFAFTTDIDGNTRNLNSRGWDIGADEAATAIYYSVGQSSSDLKTGSPTLSIDSSGNGTLDVAQTGNMGVGDYIEYGTSPYTKAYISGKTSTTVWTVQSATGSSLGVGTTMPVNSIKHSYTTLSGAIAGAALSGMMNTYDLYTNNFQLSVPCYMDSGTADTTAVTISGYTTYSTNYIKVYTPTSTTTEANNSQRHSGKWDEGKWRLESAGQALAVYANYTKIDGLQIKLTSTEGSHSGIYISVEQGRNAYVANNIIKGVGGGYGIMQYSSNLGMGYIYNNIIYNFVWGLYSNNAYVNNNTLVNNSLGGIFCNNWQIIVKNNIVQGSQDGYAVSNSSDYNISDIAGDSPGSHSRNGATVNFVDKNNYDFHLAESDTSARNQGIDSGSEAGMTYNTDIDGNTRPTGSAWDIGADEGATYIYYSVGQNTSDHKTLGVGGSAPTITLSGYTATLNVGQTAPNMGVGDLITYTGGSCFITAKTNDDKMHWNCQNATGGTAPQVSGVSVTTITHAFSLLGNATNSGSGSSASNSSHLDTPNIYTGNYVLNFPCYYDTGADTTSVQVSNWTTSVNNYIKIYTPYNTSTEANQTQRHSGKWDDSKYNLQVSLFWSNSGYLNLDGLQIKKTGAGTDDAIQDASGGNKIIRNISNSIFWRPVSSGSGKFTQASVSGQILNMWNDIIYGGGFTNIIFDNWYSPVVRVYNCTISGTSGTAFPRNAGTWILKNNIVQGAATDYSGTIDSSSTNNIAGSTPQYGAFGVQADSGTTTSAASGKLIQSGKNFTQTVKVGMIVKNTTDTTYTYVTAIDSNTQLSVATAVPSGKAYTIYTNRYGTVSFINSTGNNYHLSLSDTLARNQGIKLASYSDDSNLNFQTDIDGNSRTGSWSIGADDGPWAQMENVNLKNQNVDLNDGLVMYQSFDGDDVNIGGTVAYDRSGNGNNGAIVGATQVEGKRGQGMSFNGANNNTVDFNDSSSLSPTGSITMVSWFKTKMSMSSYSRYLINKGNAYGLVLGQGAANKTISMFVRQNLGTDDYQTTAPIAYNDGNWHQLSGIFDGDFFKLYFDGTYVGSKDTTKTGIDDSPYSMQVGYSYSSGYYFDGSIDENRIYNRALSADEIGYLYRMGGDKISSSQAGKNATGLVGHWTFDGQNVNIGTTSAFDSSGNSNTGRIVGATQTEGKLGQGMSFDGISNYVRSLNTTFATDTYSVYAWVKPAISTASVMTAWSIGGFNDYQNENALVVYNNTVEMCGYVCAGVLTSSGITIPTGAWSFIGYSRAGSSVTFFVNGSSMTTAINYPSLPTSGNPFQIGSTANNMAVYGYWNGSLDDVRVYNRALSSTEVGDLYRMGKVKIKE